jgi:hypothetical protein
MHAWAVHATVALVFAVIVLLCAMYAGSAAAALAAASASQGQLSKAQERAWEGAIDDLADLCRRNTRVRIAGQQALIPPGLAAAVMAL